MSGTDWIARELDEIRREGLERAPGETAMVGGKFKIGKRTILNFSSNDYLDLARHPVVIKHARIALERYGAGTASSRLLAGSLPLHSELEDRLATLKGYPSALVFGTGYMTNVGVITALCGREDHVFADRLSHASLIDACIQSRATLHRFRHNDPESLRRMMKSAGGKGRRLVVTESVFSMDGDIAPLAELARAASDHGAMFMVDEAHSTGVFGPAGAGLISQSKLQTAVDISMGTLSKALGAFGGFVACCGDMRKLLVNRARSFIYTTALPPSSLGAALGALNVLAKNPGMGTQLLERAAELRSLLEDNRLDTAGSQSQIVPVIVGSVSRVMKVAAELARRGILVAAVRPPTVPAGTARLRLSVTLAHSMDDIRRTATEVVRAVRRTKE